MNALLILPALVVVSSLSGEPQRTGDATCADSSLMTELDTASGEALLSLYGYDWRDLWACTSIASDLAPGTQVLRFRKIPATDHDTPAFTVVKVAGDRSPWIIPTSTGMLRVSGVEGDPHNRAAFNALLRSMPKPPSRAADWEALARLYLAVVGYEKVSSLETAGGASAACGAEGECSLSFADRAPQPARAYWKLTVTFDRTAKGAIALTDATTELVSATR